jgi:hypothetical protein
LTSLDKWNIHKSYDNVIAKQELDIYTLQQQLEDLKLELKKAKSLETKQYNI